MLTAKQEKFVQNVIAGMSQADAYRDAYNTKRMSDNAIYREASLLMSNPKITQRITQLSHSAEQTKVMSAQRRLEWLSELVEKDDEDTNAKLKAIDIMNKMSGEYVQRIDGNLSVNKLEDLI